MCLFNFFFSVNHQKIKFLLILAAYNPRYNKNFSSKVFFFNSIFETNQKQIKIQLTHGFVSREFPACSVLLGIIQVKRNIATNKLSL